MVISNIGHPAWNKGRKETRPEVLKHQSEGRKGIKLSEEHKRKLIELMRTNPLLKRKGTHHSEETRKKMVEHHKGFLGKHLSEENKQNLRLINTGKIMPKETKLKISNSLRGKHISEEHRLKIIKNHRHYQSEETKLKLKNMMIGKNLGRKMSEEAKLKISEIKMGSKSHFWKGGIAYEEYDKKWNKTFKRIIRIRDNQICMLCNIHKESLNRTLHVHHINYNKKLSIPQNCISLCNSCHSLTNTNRKKWINFFQSLLKEKYNYDYSNDNTAILNIGERKDAILQ